MVSVVKVLALGKGGTTDLSASSDRPIAEHWSLLPKKGSEKKNEIQGEASPTVLCLSLQYRLYFRRTTHSRSPSSIPKGTAWTNSSYTAEQLSTVQSGQAVQKTPRWH
jgi:hypothetical protein